jgi:hypothetical protein
MGKKKKSKEDDKIGLLDIVVFIVVSIAFVFAFYYGVRWFNGDSSSMAYKMQSILENTSVEKIHQKYDSN